MRNLFLFLLLLAPPDAILAEGGLPNQPYVYVQGQAEVQKPADMVTLGFKVVETAPTRPKANDAVQTSVHKVFALLKGHKIPDTEVIAENLSSEPLFEQEDNYSHRGKVIGYTVTRIIEVKVHDITLFPKLVDELIGLGDVEFTNIVDGLSTEKQLEDDLWTQALANARRRAEKTVKAMNMKIDSVYAASPVAYPEIVSKMFGNFERVIVTGSNNPNPTPEYRLAGVTVRQDVHVIYLISPAK